MARWENEPLPRHDVWIDHAPRFPLPVHPAIVERVDQGQTELATGERAGTPGGDILGALLQRALALFDEGVRGRNLAQAHFSDMRFLFVVGPPRSGGAAVAARLARLWRLGDGAGTRSLLDADIPSERFLVEAHASVHAFGCAVFEFCELLAWIEQSAERPATIIQRRRGYWRSLAMLDRLFGDAAAYVVTLRHPLAAALSLDKARGGQRPPPRAGAESDAGSGVSAVSDGWTWLSGAPACCGETEAQWAVHSGIERYRRQWQAMLSAIAQAQVPRERIVPVVYGEPCPQLFGRQDLRPAQEVRHDYRDILRRAARLEVEADSFEQSVRIVRQVWRGAGLSFPELPLV